MLLDLQLSLPTTHCLDLAHDDAHLKSGPHTIAACIRSAALEPKAITDYHGQAAWHALTMPQRLTFSGLQQMARVMVIDSSLITPFSLS